MRLVDWEQRLNDYIASVAGVPHDYRSHNCLIHCGKAIEAVSGVDHWTAHVDKCKSPLTAARYLKKLGADSPEQYLDKLFEEKPVGFAQRGDVVLVDVEGQRLPGVCLGADAGIVGEIEAVGEGIVRVPRILWVKAWAIV